MLLDSVKGNSTIEILDVIVQSLVNFADVGLWGAMFAGIAIGLVFGVIPGLSGLVAAALILPFVFLMDADIALPLYIAMWGVTVNYCRVIPISIFFMFPNFYSSFKRSNNLVPIKTKFCIAIRFPIAF